MIDALSANGAISSVTSTNTHAVVAAGRFEGGTNPSFVFTVQDSGAGSVTEADVDVLGNALGYVLSQGSTAHFSPDNFKAYAFPLDYALVTFSGTLSGAEAQAFFAHLGTIDEALFSGLFAGFTQIDRRLGDEQLDAVSPASREQTPFHLGSLGGGGGRSARLVLAAQEQQRADDGASGRGVSGNDWIAFPNGDQYLANVDGSARLLSDLAALRQQHLNAVESLLQAIEGEEDIEEHVATFTCPN